MTTFFCLPAYDFSWNTHEFTIATSPVIINAEKNKILLHTGKSTGKWQFIGGRYSDDMTFCENALAHAKAEIASNTVTLIAPEHPVIVHDTIDLKGYEEKTLIIHYLATIADEENIGSARWFSLSEIEILDAKNETSSANVRIVAEQILQ